MIDGEEQIVVKSPGCDGALQIGDAAWRALTFADGTRDVQALRLACERDGVVWSNEEIMELVRDLHELGFLVDGVEPPGEAQPEPELDADGAERRLVALPGFHLTCDGSGGCCRCYETFAFLPAEAQRAQRLMSRGSTHDLFTPFLGAQLDRGNYTAAHVDGRCAFLADDARCELQRKGGLSAKPLGCRTYPATFTDDAEVVRVSVRPECACVFASYGREGGDPLIVAGAVTLGDLGAGIVVSTLPEEVALTPSSTAPRSELRSWSAWLADYLTITDEDMPAILWTLATSIEEVGLCTDPPKVSPPKARSWLRWLGSAARGAAEDDGAWRARGDLHRRVTEWVADALEHPMPAAALPEREVERCYLLALNHAYRLAAHGRPLADGLRDRALRIMTARAMAAHPPAEEDPSYRHPLALLEAAMRDTRMAHYLPSSITDT